MVVFEGDIKGTQKSAKTDTQAKNDVVTLKCKIILARQQVHVKYITLISIILHGKHVLATLEVSELWSCPCFILVAL